MYSFNKRRPSGDGERYPRRGGDVPPSQQQQAYASNNYYQREEGEAEAPALQPSTEEVEALPPPPADLPADLPAEEVLAHYRTLVQNHAVAPPVVWRRIRFELPATVAELALDPPLPVRVQYTTPLVPSPCLVLLLEGLRPANTTIEAYMGQMVQYLFDLLSYNTAATAVTTLRFVKKGSEVQQMVVTFGNDIPLATLLLEQLQAAGIPAGFGPPITNYPPNATFAVHDYRLELNDGKGISREQLLTFLTPFRQGSSLSDIEVIEGYEPGIFYVPVKRPETVYAFLWNPFCSFTVQKELFIRFGVLITMAQCPHDFLKKGIPYYLQKQEKERAKALRLANSNRAAAGGGADGANEDEEGVGVSTANYFNNYGGKNDDAYREDYKEDEKDNRSSNDGSDREDGDFEDEDNRSDDEDLLKHRYQREKIMAEAEAEIDIFAAVQAPPSPAAAPTYTNNNYTNYNNNKASTPNSLRQQEQEAVPQQQQVPSPAPGGSSYPALNDDEDENEDETGILSEEGMADPMTGLQTNRMLQINTDSYASGAVLPAEVTSGYVPRPRSRQQQQPFATSHSVLKDQNNFYYPNSGPSTNTTTMDASTAANAEPFNTGSGAVARETPPPKQNDTLTWNFTLGLDDTNKTSTKVNNSGFDQVETPPPPPPPPPPSYSNPLPPPPPQQQQEQQLPYTRSHSSILGSMRASMNKNYYATAASYEQEPIIADANPNTTGVIGLPGSGGSGGDSLLPLPNMSPFPTDNLLAQAPMGYPQSYNYTYPDGNNNNYNSNNYYNQYNVGGVDNSYNGMPIDSTGLLSAVPTSVAQAAAALSAPLPAPAPAGRPLRREEVETLVQELEERVHHAFPTSVVPASLDVESSTKKEKPEAATSLTRSVPVDAQVPTPTIEISELLSFITANTKKILRLLQHQPPRNFAQKKKPAAAAATTTANEEKDPRQLREEEEEALQAGKSLLMRCLLVQGSGPESDDWRPTAAGGHHVDSDADDDDEEAQEGEEEKETTNQKMGATQLPALLPYLLARPDALELVHTLLIATVLRTPTTSSTTAAADDVMLRLLARYALPFLTDVAVGQQVLHPALRCCTDGDHPLITRLLRHGGQLTWWLVQRGSVLAQQQAQQEAQALAQQQARSKRQVAETTEDEKKAVLDETERTVTKHYISVVGNTMDTLLAQLSQSQRRACYLQVNTDAELRRFCDVATEGEDQEALVYLRPKRYRTEQQERELQQAQQEQDEKAPPPMTPLWGMHGALRRTLVRMFLSADVLSADRVFPFLFPPKALTFPTRDQLYYIVLTAAPTQSSASLSVETAALCGHFTRYLETHQPPSVASDVVDAQDEEKEDQQAADGAKAATSVCLGANEGAQVVDTALSHTQTLEAYTALRRAYFEGAPPRTDEELEQLRPRRFQYVFDLLGREAPPQTLELTLHTRQQQTLRDSIYYYNHSPVMDAQLHRQGRQTHNSAAPSPPLPQWPQLPLWREEWTTSMVRYPATGEPYPPLPEGWQGSRSRTYGHYYFKPPAGAGLSPSYRHPVDHQDYLVTPQSFLTEAVELEGDSSTTIAVSLSDRVLDAANAKLAFYFYATGKIHTLPTTAIQYLRREDVTVWHQDQRLRNYYLDEAVLQLLSVNYRVGSSNNQHSHLQRGQGNNHNNNNNAMNAFQHKLKSIHNGYPAEGNPFPSLHKGWDVNLSSSTGLYTFRAPRQGAERSYWHPLTRRPYRAAPQAFAQHRKLEAQTIADKSGVPLEEVQAWLKDQRTRHTALDKAVVELVPIVYCNFEDIKEEEEKRIKAEEERREKERERQQQQQQQQQKKKRSRSRSRSVEERDGHDRRHRHYRDDSRAHEDRGRDRDREREREREKDRDRRYRDDDYDDRRDRGGRRNRRR